MVSGSVNQGTRLEVQGGRELRRTLKQAGDDLSDFKKANQEVANIVAAASASLAPLRTGKLRRTIRGSGTKTAGIVRAGNNRSSASGVPYAAPIHWGWFKRGIRPQPFLSEGAQDSEGRWLPIYELHMNESINRIRGV